MEKEMKKLLLVAVSVGVFLLVTITVAIIILTPKEQSGGASFTSSIPYSNGRVQPASEIMGSLPPQPEGIEIQVPAISEAEPVSRTADTSDEDSLIIQIPRPSTAAVPDSIEAPAVKTPVAAAPAPAPARPAARTTQNSASRTAAAKPAASGGTINDYWVQTGAYSAMVRAEDAKELLASKGLVSIIENRVISGKTWYRVRLGPYTSEKEAGYWLALVKSIDGFGESQIRQTVRQR